MTRRGDGCDADFARQALLSSATDGADFIIAGAGSQWKTGVDFVLTPRKDFLLNLTPRQNKGRQGLEQDSPLNPPLGTEGGKKVANGQNRTPP